MKHTKIAAVIAFVALVNVFFSACHDSCSEEYTYSTFEPVYMPHSEVDYEVTTGSARDLKVPGKLYFIAPYLLIGEKNEGIHIVDNSNPNNPQNVGFIRVHGNSDMAVKGNTLYVNNFMDLLSVDISDVHNPVIQQRVPNVFNDLYYNDPIRGIVIDYAETVHTEVIDCNSSGGWGPTIMVDDFSLQSAENDFNTSNTASGVAGSMARFTIVNDYLYTISSYQLTAYNISNASNLEASTPVDVWWNAETLYPFQNNLFIGTQSGMLIYSIDNPSTPFYVSDFAHVTACDPVVAEGDYAYVTLRNGTDCQNFTNQLDVLDITDLYNPTLVKSYDMHNPHGLGIDDGILFICDGDDGLKIYDASDAEKIDKNEIAHYPDVHAFDVIPFDNILLMIGEDGFYQYDYSDLNDIKQVSFIPVTK